MKVDRRKYSDTSSIPTECDDISIECSQCGDIFIFSQLGSDIKCISCNSKLQIRVIEEYIMVSHNRSSGFVEIVQMPELPKERYRRLIDEYSISENASEKVVSSRERADFFEELADKDTGKIVASLLTDEIFGELNYRDMSINEISPDQFIKLIKLIDDGKITDDQVTDIIRKCLDENMRSEEVFEKYDYKQASEERVVKAVQKVIDEETNAVADYKDGNEEVINYLTGQVMSKIDSGTDAQTVQDILKEKI